MPSCHPNSTQISWLAEGQAHFTKWLSHMVLQSNALNITPLSKPAVGPHRKLVNRATEFLFCPEIGRAILCFLHAHLQCSELLRMDMLCADYLIIIWITDYWVQWKKENAKSACMKSDLMWGIWPLNPDEGLCQIVATQLCRMSLYAEVVQFSFTGWIKGSRPVLIYHDCATEHAARFSKVGVKEFSWPAQRPDLNPTDCTARPPHTTSVLDLTNAKGDYIKNGMFIKHIWWCQVDTAN